MNLIELVFIDFACNVILGYIRGNPGIQAFCPAGLFTVCAQKCLQSSII
jgi:hypothetical protein